MILLNPSHPPHLRNHARDMIIPTVNVRKADVSESFKYLLSENVTWKTSPFVQVVSYGTKQNIVHGLGKTSLNTIPKLLI